MNTAQTPPKPLKNAVGWNKMKDSRFFVLFQYVANHKKTSRDLV